MTLLRRLLHPVVPAAGDMKNLYCQASVIMLQSRLLLKRPAVYGKSSSLKNKY
jgi:hypothetical protein